MSVYDFYRRKMHVNTCSTGKDYPTLGERLKSDSDKLMESTWDNDIQSKRCYIYDYFHDDQPLLNSGMTYQNTTKTHIDAKFIVTQYGSISKDQVAYHLMFKPSQPIDFSPQDELYYYETDYRKVYEMQFPTGLYIDIPNERGRYEKWLILNKEQGLSFIKYNILPCNYLFEWIEARGDKFFKRKMWGVDRQQLSYDAGTWIDRYINSLNNVEKSYLPLNSITEGIRYVGENGENQRMVISAKLDHPNVWKVTKLETTRPVGTIQITFSQSEFNQHRDYIEKDSNGKIIGMWADYYHSSIEPESDENLAKYSKTFFLSASTSDIKVGGSYRTITLRVVNNSDEDITDDFSTHNISWKCFIDNEDFSENIKWLKTESFNQIKVKFPDNQKYLTKTLVVKCFIDADKKSYSAELPLNITS